SLGYLATIDQQGRRPPLMRLHMPVAVEDTVEHHIWPLLTRANRNIEHIVAGCAAPVEENLRSIRRKIRGFGRSLNGNALRNVNFFHSDSSCRSANADRLRSIKDAKITKPAIHDA